MSNSIIIQDKQIQQYINEVIKYYPPKKEQDKVNIDKIPTKEDIQQKRDYYKKHCLMFQKIALDKNNKQVTVKKFDQFVIGEQKHSIPIRFYSSKNCPPDKIAMYLHGGGFVVGDLDTHDDICMELCLYSDINICAVDYRLSPENTYPCALHDCRDVFVFLKEKYQDVLVAGDSAGAMLAAQLCLMSREEKIGNIKAQILIYAALGGDLQNGSFRTMANAPLITTNDCIRYYNMLKGPKNLDDDPYFLPIKAKNFEKLPKTAIFAAGIDPLRDDSIIYAQKLQKNGGCVRIRVDQALVHAYLRAKDIAQSARNAFIDIANNINKLANE